MKGSRKLTPTSIVIIGLLFLTASQSTANTRDKNNPDQITRAETKEAERRLSELGYWTGPVDGALDGITRTALIAFQKWQGRETTGKLTFAELQAIRNANAPEARDAGYRHVEVDIDRQVLLMIDKEGSVAKILPVSTGSGKRYSEKGSSGLAYTPTGRFRVYGKASGWKRSPLGLLYYPSYFSDGIAIHGNPSVPSRPESHGCVRIPMFASRTISNLLPVGTIVLLYNKQSFVSAKAWAEADKQKESASIP
jgi:peptidoglycan hydrolase-like protein with peptidoglycan-binding domain